MRTILSFGGGIQTTALAVMLEDGTIEADEVVFADTGGEKPETYWYMEAYTIPLVEQAGIPFSIIRHKTTTLFDELWKRKDIPSIRTRQCSDHFKYRVIKQYCKKDYQAIIGFSLDEAQRAEKRPEGKLFPLIARGMTAADCVQVIQAAGFPIPLKSSCYFCVFQPPPEWTWLQRNHPDLFNKALELEARLYERRPNLRHSFGLIRGKPLWLFAQGEQDMFFVPGEYSCWTGHCGH